MTLILISIKATDIKSCFNCRIQALNTALKDCSSEITTQGQEGETFIKFELRVSVVASLAKKPVMLTVMLINIILNFIHCQFLFLAHMCLQSCSFTVVSQCLFYFIN